MRSLPSNLYANLNSGPTYTKDTGPSTRVTVQPNWYLNAVSTGTGNYSTDNLPIRWWQDDNNSQFASEVEVPNIKSITTDASITQAAATLNLTIYNNYTPADGSAGPNSDVFGDPGHYSYAYGSTSDARAFFNQTPNSWANVLRENALLRVYQGYGGWWLTVQEAVEQGYLILKGVYLVDTCTISSQAGTITLQGRDMAKLLLEQYAYPPTVPQSRYTSQGLIYWKTGQNDDTVDAVTGYGGSGEPKIVDFSWAPDGKGYRLYGSDGGVFDYGSSTFYGSMAGTKLVGAIVSGDGRPDGKGYWMAGSDGGVFAFGDAGFSGSLSGVTLAAPIVRIRSTPSGEGYWMCGADGGVFAYGDATLHGNLVGTTLAAPIVDFVPNPLGTGYWMLGADGGVFGFGAVSLHGNATGDLTGGDKAVGMDRSASGNGYWITSASGAVFAFGDAAYHGGVNNVTLASPLTGIRRTPAGSGNGYNMVGGDGGMFSPQEGNPDSSFYGALPGSYTISIPGTYADYCLDEESEAMTRRGWLRWDEIAAGDEVLGVDPVTGEGAWHAVESVYRRHRTDWEMVRFSGASFDALTTPDHRWLVRRGQEDTLRWTTSDSFKTTDLIPLTVSPDHLPTEATWDDDFVRLVAWFWTEGSWSPYGAQLSQSMNVNPQNTKDITEVLRRLYGEPGPMRGGAHLWRVDVRMDSQHLFGLSSRVSQELRRVMDEKKSVTVDFLLGLTKPQLDEFIDISIRADGCCRSDGYRAISQREQGRIKAFEFACALAGVPCVVHERQMGGRPAWTASLLKQDYIAPVRSANQKGCAKVTRERYTGMVWCPQTDLGSFVARRKGSVYLTGNCDIIKDLALWAGFYLYPESKGGVLSSTEHPEVYGNIETTGAYNTLGPLNGQVWDKKSLHDCMTQIAQIVGYVLRVDDEGALRFHAPNWWSPGNFLEDGTPTSYVPEFIDKVHINSYTQTTSDASLVSEILVGSQDPYLYQGTPNDTSIIRFTPPGIGSLHGIQRPAMIGIPLNVPVSVTDEEILAELLGVQCYLAIRQGQLTGIYNPAICVDDQIRIIDRATGEANIHYVTGVHVEHDLDSGQCLATYTTYWLGDSLTWAVNTARDTFLAGSSMTATVYDNNGVVISEQLVSYLANTGAVSVTQLVGTATQYPPELDPGSTSADGQLPSGF